MTMSGDAAPRVDPRQLEDFLAVVEHGSIAAAATHRFTGTSSISQSIARLERRLGAKLFDRGRAGAALTSRGRAFVVPAQDALAALDRLIVDGDLALATAPHLAVATTASLAEEPTATLLGALRAHIPNLRMTISDPPGSSVADAIHPVITGTADVAVMEFPTADIPGTQMVRLPDDHLRIVCPPGTAAPSDGVFTGDDLMRVGLVVAPRFETSDVYRHLRSIAPHIDHAFVMRSQHRDAFVDFACAGIGAVILERSSADRAAQRGCVVGQVAGLPPRKIAAAARGGQLSPVAERFLRLCADQVERQL